jgi:hypothetical protein
MAELVERYIFALAHLAFGLIYQSAFFGVKNVIEINPALRFDEHPISFLRECH